MPFAQSGNDFRGSLFDFTGGLNNRAHKALILENQASDILNMIFDNFGPVKTRAGIDAVNDVATSNDGIYGLAPYTKADGTKFFLKACGTKIYKLAGTSWTEIGTGLTAAKYTDIVQSGGKAYFANGEENLKKYDGTTFAATTQVPAEPCSYLLALFNPPRLFAVGGKDAISSYYWSDAGDFDTWNANSVEALPNGDKLKGVSVLFGRPILFGEDSIWMIVGTDPSTWELRRVNSAVGCIAPKSIAFVQGQLWFAARDGIYAIGGIASDTGSAFSFDAIGVTKQSKAVQGTWNTINQDAIHLAAAGVLDNKYELSVPILSATTNDYTLYCDSDLGTNGNHPWSLHDYGYRVLAQHTPGNEPFLYGGENVVGKVQKLRTGTSDNGVAISWKYHTKYFDVNIPEFNKEFEDLFIWTEETGDWNVTLGYTIDFQSDSGGSSDTNVSVSSGLAGWGTMVWGVDKWRGSTDAKIQKRYFNTGSYGFTPYAGSQLKKRGRYIQFQFSGDTLNQYATLIGLVTSGRYTDKSTS